MGRSASPDREKRRSRSRSPSPSWQADEDCQEDHSSLDFVSVVVILRCLNELPEVPSESHKMCGFRAALDDDEQPASSCRMPVGGASSNISRILTTGSRLLLRVCV